MNILTIVLAAGLACQVQEEKDLIGFWESMAVSRGGIGLNFEFKGDGSYSTAEVVLVDLTYDIKDEKLYISKNQGEPVSYEKGLKIVLSETDLVLVGDNGRKKVRNRLTKNSSKSIVDKYRYRHYTRAIAYEKYTKDGKFLIRIPMKATNGCYTASKDTLVIKQSEHDDKQIKYRIHKGKLLMKDSNKSYSYNPVKEGAWYKSDMIDYKKPVK